MVNVMIKKVDSLVNAVVSHYASDWFEIDRPRAVEETAFVVCLRDTGVDTLFLNKSKSWGNLMWIRACLESERAEIIVYCHDGKTERINGKTAIKLWQQAMDSLPEGYREYHEQLAPNRESIPLTEWDVEKWKLGWYTFVGQVA